MISNEQLFSDVLEGVVDGDVDVAVLLRKCRLLSFSLENENLKDWVLKELNGYDNWTNLPDYRVISAPAKGFLIGPFQAQINDQPLASAILKEDHRHFAEKAFLREPASSFENLDPKDSRGYKVDWPANLVVMYQTKFIKGYALNRAWQEIPGHALAAIPEKVKNRILEFAISIKDRFGDTITARSREVSHFIDSTVMDILRG